MMAINRRSFLKLTGLISIGLIAPVKVLASLVKAGPKCPIIGKGSCLIPTEPWPVFSSVDIWKARNSYLYSYSGIVSEETMKRVESFGFTGETLDRLQRGGTISFPILEEYKAYWNP